MLNKISAENIYNYIKGKKIKKILIKIFSNQPLKYSHQQIINLKSNLKKMLSHILYINS